MEFVFLRRQRQLQAKCYKEVFKASIQLRGNKMKLTTQRLKQLIKEEIEKMNEGLPKPVADKAKRKIITYKNTDVPYYYYAPEKDEGQGVGCLSD